MYGMSMRAGINFYVYTHEYSRRVALFSLEKERERGRLQKEAGGITTFSEYHIYKAFRSVHLELS